MIIFLTISVSASEYRAWMLYYSLPVLKGIMPDQLWWHYSLLVGAMNVMLGTELAEELDEAWNMLDKFVYLFEHFYGTYAVCC